MGNAKRNTPAVGGGRHQISDAVLVNHPSFGEAFRFWLKLGFISFGGPAGQISIMYQELVDKKRWVSNERFLNALNYCMLLPGPEAQQLAVYIGWLLHKIPGGIVAGLLFLLPSMLVLFALSYTCAALGDIIYFFCSSLSQKVCTGLLLAWKICKKAAYRIGWLWERLSSRDGDCCQVVIAAGKPLPRQ